MIPALVNQMMFGRGATAAAACDLFWSNVVLLMGFEGANGATGAPGFTDESGAAHGTGTVTGPIISTAQKQFGASSASFTDVPASTLSFASSTDWQFGSGNFTIEGWVRPNNDFNTGTIVGQWVGSGNQLSWLLFAAMNIVSGDQKLHWDVSTTGGNVLADIVGSTSLVVDTWYAWAVDFDGSKYRLYLNGVMDGSFSTPRTLFAATAPLTFGTSNSGSNAATAFQDEVRITKGVARYASDSGYTVATARFPRIDCGACPAASAFLARTSGLNATHIGAYNALICGLVSDGVWAKLDVLHIYATQDSTTALLNLISSSYNGIAHGSPTFTADSGYTGTDNSTTIYIDTGFNPVTATTPQYAQDSSHLSIWVPTNLQNDIPAMGSVNLGDSIENLIEPRSTGGIATYHIQNGANITGQVVTAVSNGHSLVTRPAANSMKGYRDGAIAVTTVPAATAVLSLNMYSLGFNFGGTAKGTATPQSMISIGGGLSATDAANFYSRLRTYMTTVGVP